MRRLPVRREYYPAGTAEWPADSSAQGTSVPGLHAAHTSDPLTDPAVDAYRLSGSFDYIPRWTASHFAFFRLLVRAMCMDAGPELKSAWLAIVAAGGPEACPAAVSALRRLPPGLDWASAPTLARGNAMDLSREWTLFFRDSYREATALAAAP